jgi:rod shape-determining protein MreC
VEVALKDFFRHNGVLILIIAVLLALITLVTSVLLGGTANPIASAVGFVTTPVRNGINGFVGWVEGVYDYAFQYDQLVEENEQLKIQISEMEEKVRQAEADSRENERLRSLLGLREQRKDLTLESATVTAVESTNWYSTFTISKGENMGISAEDCVIDQYGNLVGVVTTVGLNWATVTTIIDTDTEMGGILARTDTAAILEGDFALMGEGKLKLSYLPENTDLVSGDEVLTSGRGGVYPAGLLVGTVDTVHTDDSGMTRYAIITPSADLNNLQQVFVITDFDIVE